MKHFTAIYASLVFLMLVLGLFFGRYAVTGHVTLEPALVKTQVNDFINKLPAAQMTDDADICLIIPVDNGELSYSIKKTAGTITVNQTCSNLSSYEINIKFASYQAFQNDLQNPEGFARKMGTDYVLLPSKAVQAGGTFVCTDYYSTRYCPAVLLDYTQAELKTVNNCCAQYQLTAEQKARLEQVKPAGSTGLLAANFLVLSIFSIVILFMITFTFVLTRRVKKRSKDKEKIDELKSYVVDMLSKGYSIAAIKESIASAGWTSGQIEEAFK